MKERRLKTVIAGLSVLAFFCSHSLAWSATSFPSFENLKERNVSLEMTGFGFTSGLTPGKNGKPNGNGVEFAKQSWCGSGFIVKDDGTIITNYHVARRALQAKAIFEDGASYDIKHIKVYDPIDDIAILKIKANKKFPTVSLGDSDKVNVMGKVLAVGNSLCQRLAVTEGMINQVIKDENNVRYKIRHSAAIAPGNSGGALYLNDKVVGINVATRPPYEIHYAIPINLSKRLLKAEYNRDILFQNAFPTDPNLLIKKAKNVFARNGQIPAGSAQKAGITSLQVPFMPLEDLLVYVEAPKGYDLALAITDAKGTLVGFGDLRNVEYDMILISSENGGPHLINIMNYHNTPVNFGLTVNTIRW